MTNNNRPWGPPHEIPITELPGRSQNKYDAFINDVLSRLEQTPRAAVCYPFQNEETAERYQKHGIAALRRRLDRNKAVRTSRDGAKLYVYRGPNW